MCYVASTMAGFFINKANKEDRDLSVIQIIKFVYISHGWNLAIYDTPLISDKIEAWKYGPVMPSLFHLFKGHNFSKDSIVKEFPIEEISCIKIEHLELLNKVYVKHIDLPTEELVELLHEKETPWYHVWDNEKGKDQQIKDDDTKSYYSNIMNKEKFDSLPNYPPIDTKEKAANFLKKAGILLEDGTLNPLYKND